jgi:hypothetical protein
MYVEATQEVLVHMIFSDFKRFVAFSRCHRTNSFEGTGFWPGPSILGCDIGRTGTLYFTSGPEKPLKLRGHTVQLSHATGFSVHPPLELDAKLVFKDELVGFLSSAANFCWEGVPKSAGNSRVRRLSAHLIASSSRKVDSLSTRRLPGDDVVSRADAELPVFCGVLRAPDNGLLSLGFPALQSQLSLLFVSGPVCELLLPPLAEVKCVLELFNAEAETGHR